jgi:hypothetical protein
MAEAASSNPAPSTILRHGGLRAVRMEADRNSVHVEDSVIHG